MTLKQTYRERFQTFLEPISEQLDGLLQGHFDDFERKDHISVRAKGLFSFLEKANRQDDSGNPRYSDPVAQIQDQIGARIVTYFLHDVSLVAQVVKKYFHPVENEMHVPDSDSEFGYVGQHFVLLLPTDIVKCYEGSAVPQFFELQIKTLFQHAWAEAEHDLGYKPSTPLTPLQRRKIAFTAAQAWGADEIFNDLDGEIRNVA